jgi:hypothetical protein
MTVRIETGVRLCHGGQCEVEDGEQQGEVVMLAFTSRLCALKGKRNGLTLIFISETPIPVRENTLTGSPGNCCGGKKATKICRRDT